MENMQPHGYSKRILLAVSGMSPQIVTETVYGLAVNQADPFVPTDIYLITTQSGAKEARLQLLHAGTGKFNRLCQDYELSDIHFPEANILVIEDNLGNPLDDIKTPEQNEAAADFITNVVRELTGDDNAALHVSIAGGRKTMGYYVGYALSLYGRPQDRLSHVLVTDRYESLKDFFYPTLHSHVIYDKENHAMDARDAEVMLAQIPFVRLRGGIPERLLEGKTSFNESVKFARLIEGEPKLRIDYGKGSFWVMDIEIALTSVNFIFYLWMLERALKGEYVKRPGPKDVDKQYTEEIENIYEKYGWKRNLNSRVDITLKLGIRGAWISDRINDVNTAFENALGKNAAVPYTVQKFGSYKDTKYHIALAEDQVTFVGKINS